MNMIKNRAILKIARITYTHAVQAKVWGDMRGQREKPLINMSCESSANYKLFASQDYQPDTLDNCVT